MTYTVVAGGKQALDRKARKRVTVPKSRTLARELPSQSWDFLFAVGEQIREQAGLTPEDVKNLVAEARACKS